MKLLTERQALILSIIVFAATSLFDYFLPGYPIIIGGLLLSIFLTVYISGNISTVIASILSIIVIVLSVINHTQDISSAPGITQQLLRVLLIAFTTLIVFHLKTLYLSIHSDKTHMTSLFENATEGIILTDSKGKILLVNPPVEKMFGYPAGELVGQLIEILLPSPYRHGHVKLRENFLKDPHNRIMGSGRDLYATKKTGENFPVEVSLSHYKRNNESFVIAFVVDITQRKIIENNMLNQKKELEKVTTDMRRLNTQLEEKVEERTLILKEALQKLEQSQVELNEALDKERELSEIKSRFVSMASHEFRTPLSTVLSSASLLSKYISSEDQEKRNRHIKRIKESVKHLNDILEDFLSLGKLDEGMVSVSFSEFDMKEVITDTIEEMRGLLKASQNILYRHEGSNLARADKKLLRNILINLVNNAIKFSGEGMPIEVNSVINNGKITISVADKGIGISKDDQEHLFSSFFRGKNAQNIQGTGMGLHIVKRYLDLLGGTVSLQSELDKGTIITVNFPMNQS